MAFNEKLRSPDIVEVLDVKVFATSPHPAYMSLAGDDYDSIIESLSALLLTTGEKQAFDAVASIPSASNPVVLANDVPVYYTLADFGEIRDAVPTLGDLPLSVTPTGDTSSGSSVITNVSSMSSVIPGQLVSGPGIPLNSYVVSIGVSSFEINFPATATAVGVILSVTSAVKDLRPVLSENSLYRWDGFTWSLYIHTGVLDHTMLSVPTLNADSNNQHLALSDLQTLNADNHLHGFYFDPADVDVLLDTININTGNYPDGTPVNFFSLGTLPGGLMAGTTYYIINSTPVSFQVSIAPAGPAVDITSQGTNLTPTGITGEPILFDSHALSVLPLLDLITSAGSGNIITDNERSLLDLTPGQLDALQGTTGTPSITNRYVTDFDPRINTVRNPYVTVGSAAGCSYPGTNIATFQDAIAGISSFPCTISVGSPALVTATTIYQDGDQVFFSTNDTLPSPLLIQTPYFVVNSTPTDFNLSTTYPLVTLVDTTDAGSGDFFVEGNNGQIKAIEVLPGSSYTINGGSLSWTLQNDGWLLECKPPLAATITCNSLTDTLQILPPGIGPVKIKGLVFSLMGTNTRGILLDRDYCTIEDCSFIGVAPLLDFHVGVTVAGNYTKIRNCSFNGEMTTGISVTGAHTLIENCKFNLDGPGTYAINVQSTTVGTTISYCHFENSVVGIQTGATYTQLNGNNFVPTAAFFDNGTGTRFLQNPTNDIFFSNGQAFVGRKKTLGPLGSYADFRGSTHTIFAIALADPNTSEVEVLPGTYNFSSIVTIPQGKKVRGVSQDSDVVGDGVFINNSTTASFAMSDDTTLSDIVFTSPTVVPPVSISSVENVLVARCKFNNMGIDVTSSSRVVIENSTFTGVSGIGLNDAYTVTLDANILQVSGFALQSDPTSLVCRIKNNTFIAGTVDLYGQQFIIRGNFFLAGTGIPNKLNLLDSVWQGNHPSPETNNYEGSDYSSISLGKYLDPYTPGCDRVLVNGFGALSYLKTAEASAASMAVHVPFTIDTTTSFTVTLNWTSIATSGDVVWRITVVFFDRLTYQLGTPQVQTVTSSRTHLSIQEEDSVTVTFLSYGLGPTPTNFSVDVARLPLDAGDTLPFAADLINVAAEFRRD